MVKVRVPHTFWSHQGTWKDHNDPLCSMHISSFKYIQKWQGSTLTYLLVADDILKFRKIGTVLSPRFTTTFKNFSEMANIFLHVLTLMSVWKFRKIITAHFLLFCGSKFLKFPTRLSVHTILVANVRLNTIYQ